MSYYTLIKFTNSFENIIVGFQLVRKIHIAEEHSVLGVAWLENKIYTTNFLSTMVHTFQDHEPFSEETPIEITNIKQSFGMASSKTNQAIFICDYDRWFWRIQIPDRMIRRHKIDGQPRKLSITPSDDLLVMVIRLNRFYLNIYRSSDVKQLQSILMPTEIRIMHHAVQTTNGNFVIACDDPNFPERFLVRELSKDGMQFVQTFDLQSIDSIPLKTWKPFHIAIGEDDNIFFADSFDGGHRVIQLNSRLHRIELELNHHQIDQPKCLCYVPEKHMLIVGQLSSLTGAEPICVFDCWNKWVHSNLDFR